MNRMPPRQPPRPPFPPPAPGSPSKGAYALVRVCLGADCPLPPIYRCPDCDWPTEPPVQGVA